MLSFLYHKTNLCLIIVVFFSFQLLFPQDVWAHDFEQSSFSAPAIDKSYRFQFKNVPRHLLHDLKHSFISWNGLIFVLGTGATAAFHPLDNDIKNELSSNPVFNHDFNNFIEKSFAPLVIGGVSIFALIIANETGRSKMTLAMESVIESFVLTMAFTWVGKVAINRQRPNGSKHSLPSGHTSAAFSTATVLTSFYGVKAAIPSYLLASLVGFSRMDINKHFLTDVLAGAILGTTIGLGTSAFHKKEHPKYFISPLIIPYGTGLVYHKAF